MLEKRLINYLSPVRDSKNHIIGYEKAAPVTKSPTNMKLVPSGGGKLTYTDIGTSQDRARALDNGNISQNEFEALAGLDSGKQSSSPYGTTLNNKGQRVNSVGQVLGETQRRASTAQDNTVNGIFNPSVDPYAGNPALAQRVKDIQAMTPEGMSYYDYYKAGGNTSTGDNSAAAIQRIAQSKANMQPPRRDEYESDMDYQQARADYYQQKDSMNASAYDIAGGSVQQSAANMNDNLSAANLRKAFLQDPIEQARQEKNDADLADVDAQIAAQKDQIARQQKLNEEDASKAREAVSRENNAATLLYGGSGRQGAMTNTQLVQGFHDAAATKKTRISDILSNSIASGAATIADLKRNRDAIVRGLDFADAQRFQGYIDSKLAEQKQEKSKYMDLFKMAMQQGTLSEMTPETVALYEQNGGFDAGALQGFRLAEMDVEKKQETLAKAKDEREAAQAQAALRVSELSAKSIEQKIMQDADHIIETEGGKINLSQIGRMSSTFKQLKEDGVSQEVVDTLAQAAGLPQSDQIDQVEIGKIMQTAAMMKELGYDQDEFLRDALQKKGIDIALNKRQGVFGSGQQPQMNVDIGTLSKQSRVGVQTDANGKLVFGNAKDRPNGAQCGGFTNDGLGLEGDECMGDSYESKINGASFRSIDKGGVPTQGGYFVMDLKDGIGHTGIVTKATDKGFYYTDYNWDRKGGRRDGFMANNDPHYKLISGFGNPYGQSQQKKELQFIDRPRDTGDIAQDLLNPLNLTVGGNGDQFASGKVASTNGRTFLNFDSPEAGFAAAFTDIAAKQAGDTTSGITPTSTVKDLADTWVGGEGPGEDYIKRLTSILGPGGMQQKIGEIDTGNLTAAFAFAESGFKTVNLDLEKVQGLLSGQATQTTPQNSNPELASWAQDYADDPSGTIKILKDIYGDELMPEDIAKVRNQAGQLGAKDVGGDVTNLANSDQSLDAIEKIYGKKMSTSVSKLRAEPPSQREGDLLLRYLNSAGGFAKVTEGERALVAGRIKQGIARGESNEDIMDTSYGMVLSDQTQKQFGRNLRNVLLGNSDSVKQIGSIASLINSGDEKGAVDNAERLALAFKTGVSEDDYIIPDTMLSQIDEANSILAQRGEKIAGVWDGKTFNVSKKFVNDPEAQDLASLLTEIFAVKRKQIGGTAISDAEERFLENMVPNIGDPLQNIQAKLERQKKEIIRTRNVAREKANLLVEDGRVPTLDEKLEYYKTGKVTAPTTIDLSGVNVDAQLDTYIKSLGLQ